MGLIRCKNGHLFSEKKHGNICPYCNVTVNKNGSYEHRGIFLIYVSKKIMFTHI